MIAKLGFLLVLAVFGALMFAGGMLAPEPLRQSATALAKEAGRKWSSVSAKAASASSATAAASASSAAGASAAASTPAEAKADPIPAESLLLPTPLPEKGQYAVQVGQFADATQADVLGARVKASKLPFDKVLDVMDQAGQRWSVVAVGPYASPDEARTARAAIARELQVTDSLPLIMLPAPKPKS